MSASHKGIVCQDCSTRYRGGVCPQCGLPAGVQVREWDDEEDSEEVNGDSDEPSPRRKRMSQSHELLEWVVVGVCMVVAVYGISGMKTNVLALRLAQIIMMLVLMTGWMVYPLFRRR